MLDVVITRVLTLRRHVMNFLSLIFLLLSLLGARARSSLFLCLHALRQCPFFPQWWHVLSKAGHLRGSWEVLQFPHDLDFWACLLLNRSSLCSPVLGLSCWSLLCTATMAWYRLPSARASASLYPFAFPSRSRWKFSSGVDAIISSINLSSISVWSNSHFIARVRTHKMKSSRVSSSRCRHSIRCKRWTLKLILGFGWDSKNSHSLSGLRLSSSERPDTCSRLVPSSPMPRKILSAFLRSSVISSSSQYTEILLLNSCKASSWLSVAQFIWGMRAAAMIVSVCAVYRLGNSSLLYPWFSLVLLDLDLILGDRRSSGIDLCHRYHVSRSNVMHWSYCGHWSTIISI